MKHLRVCPSVRPSFLPSSLPSKWFIPCPKKFHCFLLEPESIFINNIPVGCCQNKGNNLVARDFLRLKNFYCICTPQHYWNQIIYRFFFFPSASLKFLINSDVSGNWISSRIVCSLLLEKYLILDATCSWPQEQMF